MVLSDFDQDLLSRCLTGNEDAWTAFVDRFLPLITHAVQAIGNTRLGRIPTQWRDDVVAEVLLAIVANDFKALRDFRNRSSLGTYLVVISRRVAAKKISKMRRVQAVGLAAEPSRESIDQAWIDDREEAETLLERLPEAEATALRMFHLQQRSYAEIGTQMGIAESSVGPLLSRARERVRSLRA